MPTPLISPDFTAVTGTSVTTATSGTAASVTVPLNTAQGLVNALSAKNHMSIWIMVVEGSDVFILDGGVGGTPTATSSNVCLPVGELGPVVLTPGSVFSVITAGGSGTFSLVRTYLV